MTVKLIWSKKVSDEFARKVIGISERLEMNPNYLMTCMAFESAETFSPSIENGAGSGAVGLIQFMPTTARNLGTTTEQLAEMNAVEQLDYVEKYFRPFKGKLITLADVYMAILFPLAIGKPLNYVMFDKNSIKHPQRYFQNRGLDYNKDGKILKEEVCRKLLGKYYRGESFSKEVEV